MRAGLAMNDHPMDHAVDELVEKLLRMPSSERAAAIEKLRQKHPAKCARAVSVLTQKNAYSFANKRGADETARNRAKPKTSPTRPRTEATSGHEPEEDPTDMASPATAGYKVPVPRVVLVQTSGPLKGRRFEFSLPHTTIVGREQGCRPGFPKDQPHRAISRHHCILEINPPQIRVRDLGSRSGTYVNNRLIGKKKEPTGGSSANEVRCAECDLRDGDELKLGNLDTAVFQVRIFIPSLCASCGFPLPEQTDAPGQGGKRATLCGRCGADVTSSRHPARSRCIRCGSDVSTEAHSRHGDYTCVTCREKWTKLRPDADVPELKGYTLERMLGLGGMGSVWLGRKDGYDGPIALKVMLPSVAADQRAVVRFLQEINLTRALRHPNIVRLIQAGYHHGTFYIALEYCNGGTVDALMRQRDSVLPVDESVELTLQALDALHCAHTTLGAGKPLIHRDIKPANLFLANSSSGKLIKIGDFGLAKALDDTGLSGLTRTGETAGTPHFMPRQQVMRFKHPTPALDVWATAAALYFMLTRCPPRDFQKGVDAWTTILESDAVPIRKRSSFVPKRLAQVIDHALAETPTIGFETALEFKKALLAAM